MIENRKMTKQDRDEAKRRLCEWQSPNEMAHFVSKINNQIGSVNFISGHGLKFLQEAFIAAAFGQARLADRVRLCNQDPPDFELVIKGHTLSFEATEADDPKRRRGDEYKAAASDIQNKGFHIEDMHEDYEIVRSDYIFNCLNVATKKKVEKIRGSRINYGLVIYLNVGESDTLSLEIFNAMRAATHIGGAYFAQVWMLWQRRVYHLWSRPV